MTASIAPVSLVCFRPSSSTICGSSIAGFQHDFKYLLGDAAGDRAIGDKCQQFGGLGRVDRAVVKRFAQFVERTEQFGEQPV